MLWLHAGWLVVAVMAVVVMVVMVVPTVLLLFCQAHSLESSPRSVALIVVTAVQQVRVFLAVRLLVALARLAVTTP